MAGILNSVFVAATAALGFRLLTVGLYRRYRAFFIYLLFAAVREGVLSALNPSSNEYYYIWAYTEPVEWVLYVLVVLELYSLVLQDFQGLATVGRWALIAGVVLAVAASGLSLIAPSQHTDQGHLMMYYYVAERAVYFSLVVFLLTILGFLLQYPITLNRNIIVHSMVFSVYFVSITILYVVLSTRGLGQEMVQRVGYVMNAINIAAMGVWLVMLNSAGEVRKQQLRPAWMPGREEDLVNQLNHLNTALLRATRK
ncbi:MAG TPA: hypothetical protein VMI94_26280 [Bryobacteraceae bacterium]|nr:hypothetical protein [Bryobacteraceae bacterium]